MKIIIDPNSNAWQNVAMQYDEAKKLKAKRESIERAIAETKAKLELARKQEEKEAAKRSLEKPKIRVKEVRKREWFEAFRWFRTSNGFIVVAGREAKQNELLVAKQMQPDDLFFHADVHGAPATILKQGAHASEQDLVEAACWAASYSSAWKAGHGSCDVYAVKPDQVSKYSHGEYVAKGGFMIKGERKWFRNIELGLLLAKNAAEKLISLPANYSQKPQGALHLVPGSNEKVDLAKMIVKKMSLNNSDEVLALLPGNASILA